MKTLIVFLMIALGVGAVLYCRVNLGMSWDDMSAAIEDLIPRALAIAVVLLGAVATMVYVARLSRADQ